MGNLDILKPVLGDELYTSFLEKLTGAKGITLINAADGSYVPKAKFDTEIAAKRQYLSQVEALGRDKAALDEEIAKLKGDLEAAAKEKSQQKASLGESTKQIEELKAQIKKLTGDLEGQQKALEEKQKALEEAGAMKGQLEKLAQEVGNRDRALELLRKRGRIENELRRAGARNPEMLGRMIAPDSVRIEKGRVEGLEEQLATLRASDPYLFTETTGPKGGVDVPSPVPEVPDVNRQVNLEIRRAAGFNV